MNYRDDLARELFIGDNGNQSREQSVLDWHCFNDSAGLSRHFDHYRDMANAALAAGYRKQKVIGYVVVGRDGELMSGINYKDRAKAQAIADEWTKDCKDIGTDCDYRVAAITEAEE
jgi:hypothetical protein